MLNFKTCLLPAGWSLDGIHQWAVSKVAGMRLFNWKSLNALALVGQVAIGLEVEKREFNVFQYVDPLIGTANGGRKQFDCTCRNLN
jgi:hypothetical protein